MKHRRQPGQNIVERMYGETSIDLEVRRIWRCRRVADTIRMIRPFTPPSIVTEADHRNTTGQDKRRIGRTGGSSQLLA
jgi:hypothetical protein